MLVRILNNQSTPIRNISWKFVQILFNGYAMIRFVTNFDTDTTCHFYYSVLYNCGKLSLVLGSILHAWCLPMQPFVIQTLKISLFVVYNQYFYKERIVLHYILYVLGTRPFRIIEAVDSVMKSVVTQYFLRIRF